MTGSPRGATLPRPAPSTLALVAAFASIYVIWGSTYVAIRVAVQTLPPLTMAGVRFVVAGLLLYGWMRLTGTAPPARVHWRSAAIIGALMLLGGNGGVVWAETMVDSGVAALLVGTVPLWMVCLDALRPGGGRPNLAETMGLLLGFAGVVVLVNPIAVMGLEGASGQAAVQPLGAGLVVFGALSWAIGSLYSRHANLPESPLLSTAMEMLTGGGLLLVGGLIRGEWAGLDIARFSRDSLLALVYLTTLGSLIAFSAYIWLLRVSTPAKVATYAYVNPVAAVLFGWAVLSEPLSARIFVAMALIVLAVVLITTYGRRTPTAGT